MDPLTSAKNNPHLLIVDDDPLITDTLNFILANDFNIHIADSRSHAIALLRQMDIPPDLALVDLGLPPVPHRPDEGFALISELLTHSKEIKILVLSGQNDEANARHARSIGAMEFISKPCEPEVLKKLLFDILKSRSVEVSDLSNKTLIGKSEPIKKLRIQISQYADSIFPVLIEGESGSGKELVAGSLQNQSSRRDKPFYALNCAAISPTLVEPTLFGHAKGAFTGAAGAKSGYFEDAGEGTLLLDEIGELPLDLQAKLLRVLENGEFQRVGETQTRKSQARVIAATNRDLRRAIRDGSFRADLYHRLSVFTVNVPPLRDLGNDKMLLLEHFRQLYSPKDQTQFQLDADALHRWQDYHFPGNVRELRNIVIRLATKYSGKKIGVREIEAEFDLDTTVAPVIEALSDPQTLLSQAKQHLQKQLNFSLDDTLRLWEKNYIEAALKLTHGNVSQAAKLLGINRTTLYSRMEIYNKDQSFKSDPDT